LWVNTDPDPTYRGITYNKISDTGGYPVKTTIGKDGSYTFRFIDNNG